MATEIEVFQGNQIGGCVTVITCTYRGKTSRIMIDYGSDLPGSETEEEFVYPWAEKPVDAVFFTHYHGDHIGRFMEIPNDVDLYMGEVTYKVMLNIRKALHDNEAVSKLTERMENGSITFIERAVPIEISNGLTVTGYEVDHSAFDAYMLLVEAAGTNILHTGDYRDHGHRGHIIKNGVDHNIILDVIKRYILKNGKRKVDVLITEGTMMGERIDEAYFSEKQLQNWATDYFASHRHIFLKVSSTNADTLASFYHAARDNGMTMYANSYILNQFRVYRAAGRKRGTTMYDFFGAEKFPFISDKKSADNTEAFSTIDKMKKNGFIAIVSERDYYERTMDALLDVQPEMIYSMWDGYLDPGKSAYNEELAEFCKKYHAFSKHTSGHARKQLIEQVIETVNSTQCIWPIHTENAEGFKQLNIREELRERIKL